MMKPSTRHKARRLALQAIYQWQMSDAPINEIDTQFRVKSNPKKVDTAYFSELITGVVNNVTQLDEQITPHLDRSITAINPVELAILRLATYELIYRLDIPYKVIINEALKLAKVFGAKTSFKYINGVLDKIKRRGHT